jgi:hypothetical protein
MGMDIGEASGEVYCNDPWDVETSHVKTHKSFLRSFFQKSDLLLLSTAFCGAARIAPLNTL